MATRAEAPPPPVDLSGCRARKALGVVDRDRAMRLEAPGYPGMTIALRPLNPLEKSLAHERARAWCQKHGFIIDPASGSSLAKVFQASGDGDAEVDGAVLVATAGAALELGKALKRETLLIAIVEADGEDKGKHLFETIEQLCHWFDDDEQDALQTALSVHQKAIAPGQKDLTEAEVDAVVAASKKGQTRIPSDEWPPTKLRACVRTLAARLVRSTSST